MALLSQVEVQVKSVLGGQAQNTALHNICFKVTLERRNNETLGLRLQPRQNVLKVLEVKEGLVQTWNDNRPEEALKPEDRIVDVNGVARSMRIRGAEVVARDLLKKLSDATVTIELEIHRKPASTPESGNPPA